MIFWGFKAKQFTGENSVKMECSACGARNFTPAGIIRHIHIFWIPLFVFSRRATLQCNGCGNVLKKKEIEKDLYREIGKELFTWRRTLPRNFGILTISLVVLIFVGMVVARL